MPLYDYKCKSHGVFQELATITEFQSPKPCPLCNVLSARVIRLPPALSGMAPERRRAMEANEKAAHEPVVSTRELRMEEHRHGKGCGCGDTKRQSNLIYTAQGEKMFPSMRPWMISH